MTRETIAPVPPQPLAREIERWSKAAAKGSSKEDSERRQKLWRHFKPGALLYILLAVNFPKVNVQYGMPCVANQVQQSALVMYRVLLWYCIS